VQTEVWECLLSFSAESFVFQFAIQKYNDQNIQTRFRLLFCMGMRLCTSHTGTNTGWGCL